MNPIGAASVICDVQPSRSSPTLDRISILRYLCIERAANGDIIMARDGAEAPPSGLISAADPPAIRDPRGEILEVKNLWRLSQVWSLELLTIQKHKRTPNAKLLTPNAKRTRSEAEPR